MVNANNPSAGLRTLQSLRGLIPRGFLPTSGDGKKRTHIIYFTIKRFRLVTAIIPSYNIELHSTGVRGQVIGHFILILDTRRYTFR